nr:hypothetical protein asmbl_6 [uncultured bacterium]
MVDVLAHRDRHPDDHVQVPERGVALGPARGQRGSPDVRCPLGVEEDRLPLLRDLGGQLDVLRPQCREQHGHALAHRGVDELQRLAQARAPVRWQRHGVLRAVVDEPLAAPHLAAHLHDLACPLQRGVVGDAVPALHDLRAGGADPEGEPAVGDEVQARGGHRDQRRRAAVDRQDRAHQLEPLGDRGQVPQLAHRVERVHLGDHGDVEAGGLQVAHLRRGLPEVPGVAGLDPDAHARTLPVPWGLPQSGRTGPITCVTTRTPSTCWGTRAPAPASVRSTRTTYSASCRASPTAATPGSPAKREASAVFAARAAARSVTRTMVPSRTAEGHGRRSAGPS